MHGTLDGTIEMLHKPAASHVPMLINGASRQDTQWVAKNGNSWITYPRDPLAQTREIEVYRQRNLDTAGQTKPVMQSLCVGLMEGENAPPRPIHLGFCSGTSFVRTYPRDVQAAGVNHEALNLQLNQNNVERTLEHLAKDTPPEFCGIGGL